MSTREERRAAREARSARKKKKASLCYIVAFVVSLSAVAAFFSLKPWQSRAERVREAAAKEDPVEIMLDVIRTYPAGHFDQSPRGMAGRMTHCAIRYKGFDWTNKEYKAVDSYESLKFFADRIVKKNRLVGEQACFYASMVYLVWWRTGREKAVYDEIMKSEFHDMDEAEQYLNDMILLHELTGKPLPKAGNEFDMSLPPLIEGVEKK